MNIEKFTLLAEAYGANINRWPEIHQKQAAEMIAINLPEVNQALGQAQLMDDLFSEHTIAPVERALFDRIMETAPQQYRQSFIQRLLLGNIPGWLSFSGLVGTGLAGALAGAFCVSIWTSGMLPENIDGVSETSGSMAQYMDVGQEWS